jgi:hypothetical protein
MGLRPRTSTGTVCTSHTPSDHAAILRFVLEPNARARLPRTRRQGGAEKKRAEPVLGPARSLSISSQALRPPKEASSGRPAGTREVGELVGFCRSPGKRSGWWPRPRGTAQQPVTSRVSCCSCKLDHLLSLVPHMVPQASRNGNDRGGLSAPIALARAAPVVSGAAGGRLRRIQDHPSGELAANRASGEVGGVEVHVVGPWPLQDVLRGGTVHPDAPREVPVRVADARRQQEHER